MPCIRGDRSAVCGTYIAESGDVEEDSTAIESNEFHLFEAEEIDVIHDVGVKFASRLSGGGGVARWRRCRR